MAGGTPWHLISGSRRRLRCKAHPRESQRAEWRTREPEQSVDAHAVTAPLCRERLPARTRRRDDIPGESRTSASIGFEDPISVTSLAWDLLLRADWCED